MSDRYPYHDEDWLLDALGEKSIEEIADECDVTEDTIERWIDKHSIEYAEPQPQVDTRHTAEGEPVEREQVDSGDVESADVEVSEAEVHASGDDEPTTVETESEPAVAHPSVEFPDDIDLLGVGKCQCCGHERMLGAHPIEGNEEVSVCDECDDYLRGCTINTKRTILDNPRVPYWSNNE